VRLGSVCQHTEIDAGQFMVAVSDTQLASEIIEKCLLRFHNQRGPEKVCLGIRVREKQSLGM
jgi:hypothetical protein